MIPATGWAASYKQKREDGSTFHHHVPIVAWDATAPR